MCRDMHSAFNVCSLLCRSKAFLLADVIYLRFAQRMRAPACNPHKCSRFYVPNALSKLLRYDITVCVSSENKCGLHYKLLSLFIWKKKKTFAALTRDDDPIHTAHALLSHHWMQGFCTEIRISSHWWRYCQHPPREPNIREIKRNWLIFQLLISHLELL